MARLVRFLVLVKDSKGGSSTEGKVLDNFQFSIDFDELPLGANTDVLANKEALRVLWLRPIATEERVRAFLVSSEKMYSELDIFGATDGSAEKYHLYKLEADEAGIILELDRLNA